MKLAIIAAVVAAGLVAGFAAIHARYRADLAQAHARIASGSAIATTPCGAVEYADRGSGPAVLLVHGAGGGWDQGDDIAEWIAARGYRVVTPSRFGYLRTPLPADASPAAQADAHACLLDALGISRAAVIGVSAGGPSSMLLALRHPSRVRGLFLLVPLAWRPGPPPPAPAPAAMFVFERVLRSDFLFWSLLRVAPDLLVRTILASPPEFVARAEAGERARAMGMLADILPVSARQSGLLNDSAVAQSLPRYAVEEIRAPTVVVSLPDDHYGTYAGSRYTASRIAGAQFVEYAQGGHVWVGHHAEVLARIEGFLASLGAD